MNEPYELTEKEKELIAKVREYGPYVDFRVEKRPKKDDKSRGELVRIIVEESFLL